MGGVPDKPTVDVTDHPEAHRYEARIGDDLVAFAEYQLTDGLIVFTHTEVEPRCEGMGVGSALARAALDDVRRRAERRVLPLCPFISGWIGHHPDYQDLVETRPTPTAKD